MRRLLVLVEGQSEEGFVNTCVARHLAHHGVAATPIVVETSRHPRTGAKRRGGGRWHNWLRDLRRLLPARGDPEVCVTTMFDLYGLPGDFPDLAELNRIEDTFDRARAAELRIAAAVGNDERLIPYVQRHEFEALVLASINDLLELLDDPAQRHGAERLRRQIAATGPEDVNDGRTSAPSKRLLTAIPGYQKTVHGLLAIESFGLPALRSRCPRFDEWIGRLEGLR